VSINNVIISYYYLIGVSQENLIMSNFSISINKQGSFLELSCIHKGLKISKVYHGYTMANAIKLFQEYLNDGFK